MAVDGHAYLWLVFRLNCYEAIAATTTSNCNGACRFVVEPEIYMVVEITHMSCAAVWKARTLADY